MAEAFEINMIVDPLAASYPTFWAASPGVVFLPSVTGLDWEHDSEHDRRKRAVTTARHATENKMMERSECSWEFDAWRDVFSQIRDDPLFAM
jgi:hypothetical protein